MKQRVAILISGGGSNMLALLRDMVQDDHPAMPVLVVSSNPQASGLVKASTFGVPTVAVSHRSLTREAFEAALLESIFAAKPDILLLAGFMRVLTPSFVTRWEGRMINIHPSLLPAFTGLRTHQRAIDAGCQFAGVTVHQVTAELDHGLILAQAVVPVLPGDTADALAARVLSQEHLIYPRAIAELLLLL